MTTTNNQETDFSLQNKNEKSEKNYRCIVIWTFYHDENNHNYDLIHKALQDFEPIDQSTMGSENVDPQAIYNQLLSLDFHENEGDFIKIISSDNSEKLFSYNANKQLVRILYITNITSSQSMK